MRFVESEDPGLLARLARCRATFATSLVGRWSTVSGTFDAMMRESWEFRTEGTLVVTYESGSSGTEHEVYRWESEGPFRVRLGLPPDEDEPEGTSKSVLYEFAIAEHDAGREVVLREVGRDSFWGSFAPLRPDD